jgi:hypothetical protein
MDQRALIAGFRIALVLPAAAQTRRMLVQVTFDTRNSA